MRSSCVFYRKPRIFRKISSHSFKSIPKSQNIILFFYFFSHIIGFVIQNPLVFLSKKHRRKFYIPKRWRHTKRSFSSSCHGNRFFELHVNRRIFRRKFILKDFYRLVIFKHFYFLHSIFWERIID